jgi:biopolymer transport protein ExbD
MAGGADQGDDDIISGINVTPLVDVVLVLLIILMVTAKQLVQQGRHRHGPAAGAHG